MATIAISFADLVIYGILSPFLVYLLASWTLYLYKLIRGRRYRPYTRPESFQYPSISIIIPVYNEDSRVWQQVLDRIEAATSGIRAELIIVPNGGYSEHNALAAEARGHRVYRLERASKRHAIARGAELATHDIAIILDSDTFVSAEALRATLWPFVDPRIGGVTPRHAVRDRHQLMRRMSDWLEDNRFNELVKGQSVAGAVSCLPGRLFAMRTAPLKDAAPYLVSQTFLGMRCISGDDRFLTSWLLAHGYQTVYQQLATVETEAPDTFRGFLKQRLRWSRGSFRGTLFALPWLWRHPYTLLTVTGAILLRWSLFAIVVTVLIFDRQYLTDALSRLSASGLPANPITLAAIGLAVLYVGGIFKRLRHLVNYPQDLTYYPVFLTLVVFVLTPLEWYGNLTCWKQGWLTRSKRRT